MRKLPIIKRQQLLFLFFMMIGFTTFSQSKITLNLSNTDLITVFKSIENQSNYTFFYNTQKINTEQKVSVFLVDKTILEVLNTLFVSTDISFIIKENQVILTKLENTEKKNNILEISGVVKNNTDNSTLPGATIAIKNSSFGVTTDFDGKFKIQINSKDIEKTILQISYVGFETKTINLKDAVFLEIFLVEEQESLQEVIITSSYGTKKLKEEVVGSIASINLNNLTKEQPTINFDELLEGQVPGVFIETNPRLGEVTKIDIRGQGSITPVNSNIVGTSTQPLIIVDGIILTEEVGLDGNNFFDNDSGNLSENILNPLSKIGVEDIESFNVLKDAAAVGLYGADSANGVIIITTKRGKKGKTKFTASSQIGVSNSYNQLKFLNGLQYQTILNEYWKNANRPQNIESWNGINTNWFNLLDRQGLFSRINFGFSGGNKNLIYRANATYQKTDEPQLGNSFEKLNTSFSLGYSKNKLSLDFVVLPSLTIKKDPNKYYSFAVPSAISPFTNGEFTPVSTFGNPLALASQNISTDETTAVLSSLKATYNFTENVSISSLVGIDFSNKDEELFFNGLNGSGFFGNNNNAPNGNVKGRRILRDRDTRHVNFNAVLNYKKKINKNNHFDGILGLEIRKESVEFRYAKGDGFLDFSNPQPIEKAFREDYQEDSFTVAGRSLFTQLNYNYKHKYFFLINLRVDQSSAFGSNKNTALNGGIGASWVISKEDFLISNKFIDFFRLRASFGSTGNSRIGSYRALGLYENGENGYNGLDFANLSSAQNPNLSWEKNKKFNIGIDFNFLSKFKLSVEYYRDLIEDQIILRNIPIETGFNSAQINGASMVNQGFEFSLNTKIIEQNNFSWKTNFNLTTLSNTITSLQGLGNEYSAATFARAEKVGFSTSTL